jgi:hypothetical protein
MKLKIFESFRKTISTDMLNDILDKISEFGIKSLSDHEMTLLKSYSDEKIDVEKEIQKHQNKYLTAKSIVRDVIPLAVDCHELERNIGRFIKFKKGDPKADGLLVSKGSIYEIIGIQKHWGYDENGKYVPDRIGYRVARVNREHKDFGRVCPVERAIFVNITEEEAIEINQKIWKE